MNRVLLVLVSALAVLAITATSGAGIIWTGHAPGNPDFPNGGEAFTFDPWKAAAQGNKGITETRAVAQTFKTDADIEVHEIAFSFRITGGDDPPGDVDLTGLVADLYEVADTLASPLTLGTLVGSWSAPPEGPGYPLPSGDWLKITLTGDDIFTLPARNTGTEGYALVLTTLEHNTGNGNGNPGTWYYPNDSTHYPDPYADGAFYFADPWPGNLNKQSTKYDAGLAINPVPEPSTLCLALVALCGLAGLRSRRDD